MFHRFEPFYLFTFGPAKLCRRSSHPRTDQVQESPPTEEREIPGRALTEENRDRFGGWIEDHGFRGVGPKLRQYLSKSWFGSCLVLHLKGGTRQRRQDWLGWIRFFGDIDLSGRSATWNSVQIQPVPKQMRQ
jgi:hypothetical protein